MYEIFRKEEMFKLLSGYKVLHMKRHIYNIFIYSLYARLFFYTKNLLFIEEHYMFRHISAIIRCYHFSILTLNILKSYA
jgi:hypothetical protein